MIRSKSRSPKTTAALSTACRWKACSTATAATDSKVMVKRHRSAALEAVSATAWRGVVHERWRPAPSVIPAKGEARVSGLAERVAEGICRPAPVVRPFAPGPTMDPGSDPTGQSGVTVCSAPPITACSFCHPGLEPGSIERLGADLGSRRRATASTTRAASGALIAPSEGLSAPGRPGIGSGRTPGSPAARRSPAPARNRYRASHASHRGGALPLRCQRGSLRPIPGCARPRPPRAPMLRMPRPPATMVPSLTSTSE